MRQLTIFTSAGVRVAPGAELAAGNYYCELSPGDFECARLGCFQFVHDAAIVFGVTFEVTNLANIATYAAAAAGWTPAPTNNPTVVTVAGGSAGVPIRYVTDVAAARIRAVLAVTAGGVAAVHDNTKEG